MCVGSEANMSYYNVGGFQSNESYYDTSKNEKLNPEAKALWLEALRSDEYKQGKGALRVILESLAKKRHTGPKAQRFCCLGVLCDVYLKATGKGQWKAPDNDARYSEDKLRFAFSANPDDARSYFETGMPPQAVMQWANLPDHVILDKADARRFNYKEDDANEYANDDNVTYRPEREFYFAGQNDDGRTFKSIAYVIEKYL